MSQENPLIALFNKVSYRGKFKPTREIASNLESELDFQKYNPSTAKEYHSIDSTCNGYLGRTAENNWVSTARQGNEENLIVIEFTERKRKEKGSLTKLTNYLISIGGLKSKPEEKQYVMSITVAPSAEVRRDKEFSFDNRDGGQAHIELDLLLNQIQYETAKGQIEANPLGIIDAIQGSDIKYKGQNIDFSSFFRKEIGPYKVKLLDAKK